MAKRKRTARAKRTTTKTASQHGSGKMTLAIVALVLNVILPGLGSLIAGKVKLGIWQLILIVIALASAIFFPITIFYIIWTVSWIWALVSSIKIIKKAR